MVYAIIFCCILVVFSALCIIGQRNLEKEEIRTFVSEQREQIKEYEKKFLLYCQDFFGIKKEIKKQSDVIILRTQEVTKFDGDYIRFCDLLKETVTEMQRVNANIVKADPSENQSEKILYYQNIFLKFNKLAENVKSFSESLISDTKYYGKTNSELLGDIHRLDNSLVLKMISKYEKVFEEANILEICQIDLREVLKYIWFLAMDKPFSIIDFKKAKNIFLRIYKKDYVDIIIAEWYAQKQVGGEEVLKESVQKILKENQMSRFLIKIASGLMWMKAYQTESIVLQYMLTTAMPMPLNVQNRLHALVHTKKNSFDIYDVKSTDKEFFFDVSSLTWKEEDYLSLFENLAFQDKKLSYSLAVRDESHELFITQDIKVPDTKEIFEKFKFSFEKEYDSIVSVRMTVGTALSGNGKEKLKGIIVCSKECKQLGIFSYFVKIGKKFGIKLYILFIPENNSLEMQKQQLLSIYKKLSPSVTMWENSLKNTILIGVQQLINNGIRENDIIF